MPITEDEIKQVLQTAPNRSVPGYDRITHIDFKISNVINILKSIFNICLQNVKYLVIGNMLSPILWIVETNRLTHKQ